MKRFYRLLPLLAVLVAGLAFGMRLHRLQQVRYRVTLLQVPAGAWCAPFDLNDAGTLVVASGSRPDGQIGQAHSTGYVCQGDTARLADDATHAVARAVNARGDMAGWINGPMGTTRIAVLCRNGRSVVLSPSAVSSEARAINDSGVVVGSVNRMLPDGKAVVQHAALWRNSQLTDLGRWPDLAGEATAANDVNNAGVVVGRTGFRGFGYDADFDMDLCRDGQAGIWKDGRFMLLTRGLGRTQSEALAINDQGLIVGYYRPADRIAPPRAVLWANGAVRTLRVPGSVGCVATDINNAGRIVGSAMLGTSWSLDFRRWRTPRRILVRTPNRMSAVLWEGKSTVDLNNLIPPSSGWHLERAFAINDKGQIAGTGCYNGQLCGFVLTPVR